MIIGMSRGRNTGPPLAFAIGAGAHRLARLLSGYKIELLLACVLFAMGWASVNLSWWVPLLVFVLLAGLTGHPDARRYIGRLLNDAHTRRKVSRAASDSGFENLQVKKVSQTLPGELVEVYVPRGATVDGLDKAARAMAGCLRVSDVRVIHDREDRSHAELSIVRRDPFKSMLAMEWPLLNAEEISIREPFPWGKDEYGREVKLQLLSSNLILGGAPNAGKSVALRIVAATAALDSRNKLWMMDAKTGGAEFTHWAPAAEEIVRGRDLTAAVSMLKRLEERIEKRGQEIVARGEVFITDDMETDVLMIDELPQFTRSFETDTKEQASAVKAIKQGIWRLIALGRWTGMMTVLSAQKPTADIVPSEFRDLIDLKFALHCNTRAMSDAILGDGSGSEITINAAEIPTGQPGVGYLIDGEGALKMRAYFISPKQALEVATRVTDRQIDAEWLPA
jgi:hypothetical protein